MKARALRWNKANSSLYSTVERYLWLGIRYSRGFRTLHFSLSFLTFGTFELGTFKRVLGFQNNSYSSASDHLSSWLAGSSAVGNLPPENLTYSEFSLLRKGICFEEIPFFLFFCTSYFSLFFSSILLIFSRYLYERFKIKKQKRYSSYLEFSITHKNSWQKDILYEYFRLDLKKHLYRKIHVRTGHKQIFLLISLFTIFTFKIFFVLYKLTLFIRYCEFHLSILNEY